MGRLTALVVLALAGTACPAGADVNQPPRRSTELPRPRDGNVAVREELDAARRAGTVKAYDLFIARNRRHRLAAIARRERARLMAPRR
jgi:hypothetical protein